MLYDILIIDDDFSLDLSKIEREEWGKEHQDKEYPDAVKILYKLIKKRLRVTCTTGYPDLEKFTRADLSRIRFIFLDLQLNIEAEVASVSYQNKGILSNLMGIIDKLNQNITEKEVLIFSNSKFLVKNEGLVNNLEKALQKKYNGKYKVEEIKQKNNISNKQINLLLERNLHIYCKSLIINQAIEVEKNFDKRLSTQDCFKDKISFESKYKVFKNAFSTSPDDKKEILLLKEIRNKLAHTEANLREIKDDGLKKTFWKIIENQTHEGGNSSSIKFKNFDALIKYVESIDELIVRLNKMKTSNKTKSK